jgi:hypothetical protein
MRRREGKEPVVFRFDTLPLFAEADRREQGIQPELNEARSRYRP